MLLLTYIPCYVSGIYMNYLYGVIDLLHSWLKEITNPHFRDFQILLKYTKVQSGRDQLELFHIRDMGVV